MERSIEIAEHIGLTLIEDAAQAIGAEYPYRWQVRQGRHDRRRGCFSFYPSKNLGAAGRRRDGRLPGRSTRGASFASCRQHGMEPRYFHHFIGGNFRLDEIQAAILHVKLPYLERWSAARRAVADYYREEFNRAGLTRSHLRCRPSPTANSGVTNHHIYHQYVIRTPQRDALREHLAKNEIGTAIYYPLGLHQQECFAYLGYKKATSRKRNGPRAKRSRCRFIPSSARSAAIRRRNDR